MDSKLKKPQAWKQRVEAYFVDVIAPESISFGPCDCNFSQTAQLVSRGSLKTSSAAEWSTVGSLYGTDSILTHVAALFSALVHPFLPFDEESHRQISYAGSPSLDSGSFIWSRPNDLIRMECQGRAPAPEHTSVDAEIYEECLRRGH